MSLTIEHYRSDFLALYDLVMEVHPKPDFKVPVSRLEAERDYALSRLGTCNGPYDFWGVSQRFLNVLGDLQTRVDAGSVLGDMVQVPILTDLVDGRVVVDEVVGVGDTRFEGVSALCRGDEILFVDGREVEGRLQELLSLTSYNSSTWGRRQAAKGLLLFPSSRVQGESRGVAVTVAKADGTIIRVDCPLIPVRDPIFTGRGRAEYLKGFTDLVECGFMDDGAIGRLTFRGFQDRHMVELNGNELAFGLEVEDIPYMDEVLWDFFSEARSRRTRRLVIDLRGAQGGSPQCMDMPLKFLTKRPLKGHRAWAKVTPTLRKEWSFFAGMTDGVHDIAFDGVSSAFPYYTSLGKERLGALEPFTGDVIVVIDDTIAGGTWLAATIFANGLGTFVGEPARVAAEPGSIVGHRLPNTGLWLMMSCMFFEPPAPGNWPVEAILPKHRVWQTIDDYRRGTDTLMEAAIRLCRSGL